MASNELMQENIEFARALRDALAKKDARIVLAESCTAGRVAATLGAIPGISSWLSGSFVIYRNDSKHRWLGIPTDLLDDPQIGPVSQQVTGLLARAIVERTPEARFGIAVTGDIGPGAPSATDGVCFCAVFDRENGALMEKRIRLLAAAPQSHEDITGRLKRLEEASCEVLKFAVEVIGFSAF